MPIPEQCLIFPALAVIWCVLELPSMAIIQPVGWEWQTGLLKNCDPAMSFVSRILQVKTLPEGTGVSYGHTFRTQKQTRMAVIPVGYEDGYSRSLSNKGKVLIHGHRVPLRGRICMNMSIVDVSEVEGVKAGDEVVLLGQQGQESITADDIAAEMGSISYEVLCLLGNNNQREYIE